MINVFLCILHIEFQYVEIGGIMFVVLFKRINLKLFSFNIIRPEKKLILFQSRIQDMCLA